MTRLPRGLCWKAAAVLAASLGWVGPAAAGPPFITDDPEPTDLGRWEVYAYASGVRSADATEGAAGLDLNFGAAKDLQLTLDVPMAFQRQGGTRTGLGDVEAAAKYRFVHQREGTMTPDVAFFPRLVLPTASRRFGSGHVDLFLPIWAQKDFGHWSVFGGGGYQIRGGPEGRNNWLAAMAATRQVTERWLLGAEVYHQTADEAGAHPFTGLSVGTTYRLNDRWSLLASGGPGVQNSRQGRFAFYASLRADF